MADDALMVFGYTGRELIRLRRMLQERDMTPEEFDKYVKRLEATLRVEERANA